MSHKICRESWRGARPPTEGTSTISLRIASLSDALDAQPKGPFYFFRFRNGRAQAKGNVVGEVRTTSGNTAVCCTAPR
jgi:hypothetical protein